MADANNKTELQPVSSWLHDELPSALQMAAEEICRQAEARRQPGGFCRVAIDGRCGAGKSTLARCLAERGFCVISMDDFFLQPYQRTEERYRQPGENVDHERFAQEVLLPLSQGKEFVYRPYDFHHRRFLPPVTVPAGADVVVEGSYACHPLLRAAYTLRVFLTVAPATQWQRICARNGAAMAERFRKEWIPLEERYFSACAVQAACELCFET